MSLCFGTALSSPKGGRNARARRALASFAVRVRSGARDRAAVATASTREIRPCGARIPTPAHCFSSRFTSSCSLPPA